VGVVFLDSSEVLLYEESAGYGVMGEEAAERF
jgi:hypothetical protein